MRGRTDFQKVGWGIHGAGNVCGCHKDCDSRGGDTLKYSPGQMNALLKKVEQMGESTNIAVVDLKGKKQNDMLIYPTAQCRFVYAGQDVEAVAVLHENINGTLVFCDVKEDDQEEEKLYWISNKSILNVWDIADAPEWTQYWTTKSQAAAIRSLNEKVEQNKMKWQ